MRRNSDKRCVSKPRHFRKTRQQRFRISESVPRSFLLKRGYKRYSIRKLLCSELRGRRRRSFHRFQYYFGNFIRVFPTFTFHPPTHIIHMAWPARPGRQAQPSKSNRPQRPYLAPRRHPFLLPCFLVTRRYI